MMARSSHVLARTRVSVRSSVFALLLTIGPALGAQDPGATVSRSCLDTISASAFVRVPMYLEAKAANPSAEAILPFADTLAIRAVAMIRSSLGASPTSLPEGETLLHWRQVGGAVRVTASRDGRFTWSPLARRSEDTLRAPSRQLVAQALSALRDAGAKVGWPADVAGDSLSFDLQYRWPDVAPDGTLQPLLVRVAAIPMFSMAMPRSTPVVVRRPPRISYPGGSQSASAEGTIVIRFIVDSTGRVAQNTIEDRWPTDRPRPAGHLAEHYRAFLNAVRWGLSGARYDPATRGGCAVPQLVEQPFNFALVR